MDLPNYPLQQIAQCNLVATSVGQNHKDQSNQAVWPSHSLVPVAWHANKVPSCIISHTTFYIQEKTQKNTTYNTHPTYQNDQSWQETRYKQGKCNGKQSHQQWVTESNAGPELAHSREEAPSPITSQLTDRWAMLLAQNNWILYLYFCKMLGE